VAHAHANLVVHRDIKPTNVLVGCDGRVRLLDFGIAKLLEEEALSAEATALTREGGPVLTPEYAAPEQMTGGTITTAADVYALGTLLYVVLAGRHPAGAARSSPAELLKSIVEVDPPRLSAAAVDGRADAAALARSRATTPDGLGRELAGDLETIVAKALKKSPAERYPSVSAFADDLRRYLGHEPISARADTLRYRAGKFVRRHRRSVAAAAAGALVLGALVAFYTARLARERDRARIEAEKAARMAAIASEDAQRAEAVRRFLVGVFERASPDENKGQPITAPQLLEKGEQQVDSLRDQPALRADVTVLLGQLYREISDFARAEALVTRALAESDRAAVPDVVRARVLIGMAGIEDDKGDYDQALARAEQGLALLEPAPPNMEEIAIAHEIIGHCLTIRGDPTAEARLREALRQDGAALGERSEAIAAQWLELGEAIGNLGRYTESEAAFRNGIRILRALYGENSNHVAHALNEMSNMLDDKGDLAGAEAALRQALAIRLATVGPDHHDTMAVESNLLVVVEYQGRYAEGLAQRLKDLDRDRRSGRFHPLDLAAGYTAMGVDCRELGRMHESEAYLRQALATIGASQGPRSARSTNTLHHLGMVMVLEGRYREAEATFREALDIQLAHGPGTAPAVAIRRADLGNLLRLERRHKEALAELEQAASVIARQASATNRSRPLILAALSEGQLDAGDAARARETAEQAVSSARRALPSHHLLLGVPLYALARSELALLHPEAAEPHLREALEVRGGYPAGDPRTLEVEVGLVAALAMLKRDDEARALRAEIEPPLTAASSPYARELRRRLAAVDRS
jgi:serine/threonine-protein kinase